MALKSELNAEMKRLKQDEKALRKKRDQLTADIDGQIAANGARQKIVQDFMDATYGKKEAKGNGRRGRKPKAQTAGTSGKRRTRKNRSGLTDKVLATVNASVGGIKRAGIIDALGLSGDKAGHQYVSNILTELRNSNRIRSEGRFYFQAAVSEASSSDSSSDSIATSGEDDSSAASDSAELSSSTPSSEDSSSGSSF